MTTILFRHIGDTPKKVELELKVDILTTQVGKEPTVEGPMKKTEFCLDKCNCKDSYLMDEIEPYILRDDFRMSVDGIELSANDGMMLKDYFHNIANFGHPYLFDGTVIPVGSEDEKYILANGDSEPHSIEINIGGGEKIISTVLCPLLCPPYNRTISTIPVTYDTRYPLTINLNGFSYTTNPALSGSTERALVKSAIDEAFNALMLAHPDSKVRIGTDYSGETDPLEHTSVYNDGDQCLHFTIICSNPAERWHDSAELGFIDRIPD